MDRIAISFVEAIERVFDTAIVAAARVVCSAIDEPDIERHRMPYLTTKADFWQHVSAGYFSGLRPDQVRMIETFQPLDEVEPAASAAASMVRNGMRHLANLRRSVAVSEAPLIVVWAHSALPEVHVEPPSRVLSIESTGDGVLVDSRVVATYEVAGAVEDADVRANPNIAFDVIANQPPWPADPDDNFSARSRLLIITASEFIRGCERSVGLRAPLHRVQRATASQPATSQLSWAPVRLECGSEDLTSMMSQSGIGLATYRNDDGEFIMLVQVGDTVYGRPIPPATLLDPSQRQGTAAEDAAIEAASMWGLPDFVFRPRVISKGSGRRELGDATIITGAKAVAVQVKSRERPAKDDAGEARWLVKKAREGARQAGGTVRTLRRGPADLVNGRGRSITCHGDQLTWIGVVILDHPSPPEDIDPPAFDVGIPIVTMLRRDWDFLFDHLRSVSAVVDYLHRIVEEPPVSIGEEPARYFELAHADENAPTGPPDPWIEQTGASQSASPILPKAPASAADASGHAIFRVLLEDIAESAFDGEEEQRLEMLAKLDRFSVGDRAELGRLLMQRLDAASRVDADKTSWQHRLVIQDHGTLQLFFSVGSHFTETHRDIYKGWVLLRRHEFIELTATDPEPYGEDLPWTVAVLLTPRHDGYRAWDTTLIATHDDTSLDADERARLTALWDEARVE
ncbi:MAG: hypothetical protein J0H43_09940 [Actinobacteria bacterium]|nr:hypothetical protein [Actinomycetota bacterium]